MNKNLQLIFLLLIIFIIGSVSIYFYLQKQAKEKEAEQIKTLLVEINEGIFLMDDVKDKMPPELLDIHNYLMSGALGGKIYRTDPKLKDNVIMYHGAKSQSIYINPAVKLKKELWIPVFYHEVAHNYWHNQNPIKTFEEFKNQLFNSENYAYAVNAQAWDLVMMYYPIKPEDLKTELEQRLFRIYSQETEVYNEMMNGNLEAKGLWNKIIEADIKEQEKQQRVLF